ncbi:MAG: PhnA domain-containing protein [Porticoccaceae bacterium]|nr:PhnA domain-containing protein [Porticoccaceae bacterium]MDG1473978.1 PhnA domain-containing protein [Porticoccaceae bacterium]
MNLSSTLQTRSNNACELCSSIESLNSFAVTSYKDTSNHFVVVCNTCEKQLTQATSLDESHWRCLHDSMWTQVPVVQVLIWRILSQLDKVLWAQDLLEMLYLEDDTLDWAKALEAQHHNEIIKHKDCHGTLLSAGDTVTLTKDLNIKGVNFNAKRGTSVRNILLVPDNAEQIEGRINGTQIVILTKFVKRVN